MKRLTIISILLMFLVGAASAETVKVAVHKIEPCVMGDGNGGYKGFEIDIIERVAEINNWNIEYHNYDVFKDVFSPVQYGEVDFAAAGITILESREASGMDFTHQHLPSGLSIAVLNNQEDQGFGDKVKAIFEFKYLRVFLEALLTVQVMEMFVLLFIFIFIMGNIVWFAERGEDKNIPDRYFPGIFYGMYYSLVTSSTVGYGDITCIRWTGKIATMFLIVMGILFFANVTALFSADYTTAKIQYAINGPQDLKGKTVLTVAGSTSVPVLHSYGAKVLEVPKLEDVWPDLLAGKGDAVVYDAPMLKYYVTHDGKGKVVLVGGVFDVQYYGFPFHEGSPLVEPFNRALLKLREDGSYGMIHAKWFGN